jgi:hypothetical protein
MKNALACLGLFVVAFVLLLNVSCQSTKTVVAPVGPKTEQLGQEQQKQIAALGQQLEAKDSLLGDLAGNVYGIGQGAEKTEASKGKEIITAEADLAHAIVGDPTPAKKAEADARILATVKGDLAEQKKLYGSALDETSRLKLAMEAEQKTIKARDEQLVALRTAADTELAEQKSALEKVIADKDAEVAAAKAAIVAANKKHADDLLRWASRILVGTGMAVVLGCGALLFFTGIAALTKAVPGAVGGMLLIGAGYIVGQTWFIYVAGGGLALILIGGGLVARHLWLTGQIERKLRASVQDLKDEASVGVPKAVAAFSELKEHLRYRIPRAVDGAKTSIEKAIDSRMQVEGANTAPLAA